MRANHIANEQTFKIRFFWVIDTEVADENIGLRSGNSIRDWNSLNNWKID